MTQRVEHCEASTISEAWALVVGAPGPLDEGEKTLLLRGAKKTFDNLNEVPAFIIQKSRGEAIPAFWNTQAQWADSSQLARFGHRFLSVHRVATAEHPYGSYQLGVGEPLGTWLGIASDAAEESYPVERTGFGYVNSFQFDSKDFDISRYFKLGLFLDLGESTPSIHALEASFKFEKDDFLHQIQFSAEPQSNQSVRVVTKVFVERTTKEDLEIADRDRILESVVEAHETAKSAFFDFATKETHTLMKAQYASS